MNGRLIKRISTILILLFSLVCLYVSIAGYLSESNTASGTKVEDILAAQDIRQSTDESLVETEAGIGEYTINPAPYLRLSLAKAFGIEEKDDLSGRINERMFIIYRDPSASGSKADYVLKGIVRNAKGVSAVIESLKSRESYIVRKGDTITLKMPDGSTADWRVEEIHSDRVVLK